MTAAPEALYKSDIKGLSLLNSGKVRDIYDIDAEHMLIVTTDRISAFDVILPDPIPGKGRILTSLSNFWFARMQHIIPNHLTGRRIEDVLPVATDRARLEGRSIIVKKLRPLPVEAVVRGYLIGSGWKDYQRSGAVCGIRLPDKLPQAARLPEPIFTPSTKAEPGEHDENIGFDSIVELLGRDMAEEVRDTSLRIYRDAVGYAADRGIIIADTKFEFGTDKNGELVLIDELLTPDSSRFWPADSWRTGISPPSYDKQYVRDYLETLDWNKKAPGPKLPAEVIRNTAARYLEAEQILTGK
ncbi:MAG TPA: phosphoribosylaminoimidazolesuccinocarboxamide synthase [Gammaproteobacteria bacterium]|nr:phosphoribosylaminoimidazolesuccinocarboxamide synthase [Gammaproteobacteria bacterium]